MLALEVSLSMFPATIVEDDFSNIGGRLKAAREAAGLTMDDVQFRTHLPRSVMEALEAEDFSVFTSPVYAKSFLAQYSDFLKVDAQRWLDALVPGSFMPGDPLRPVVVAPEFLAVEKMESSETRGGWLSILALLALSAALVAAAIKGYEFFEARFGGDVRHFPVKAVPAAPEDAAKSAVVPEPPPETKPRVEKEDEEFGKPTPRAIIVR